MGAELRLPAIALPGLLPDSLGNYLASLGLLRVLSRRWSSTRIAWRDEVLQVVGGPTTLNELLEELIRVARDSAWTPYERGWLSEMLKGTKLGRNKNTATKAGAPIAEWRAKQSEDAVAVLDAHIVATTRQMFNPLTGNGGSAGNRDFTTGWQKAKTDLAVAVGKFATEREKLRQAISAADEARDVATGNAKSESLRTRAIEKHKMAVAKATEALQKLIDPAEELKNALLGTPTRWMLEKLNGASWFSNSNKLYNSGQSPSRDGQVSPWLMVFACEGLLFFAGGASRRLGARSAVGAFPFVTQPIAASAEKEADRLRGEIWTPLWSRPMSLAEAGTLFSRGRAELHGRGALNPATFATAIQKRGVDAGVSEFRRFTLGRTTSSNTFEPRLEARFSLTTGAEVGAAVSATLERVTALIEQRGFPRDGKRFVGLRGPIESALLDVAADPTNSEAGIALLNAVVGALDRVDRNRSFREGKLRWEPLPLKWLPSLFADEQPGVEARLALSLVSAFPETLPFTSFRFGVEWVREQNGKREYDWATQPRRFEHSKVAPARWVWGPGELARALGAALSRLLLEEAKLDATRTRRPRARAPLPATTSQIRQWLAGDLDESLFAAWLSRFALFDWRSVSREVRDLIPREDGASRADGELALLGLLQPLIDRRPLIIRDMSPNDLLSGETGARTTEAARSLVALTRAGNLDGALRLASSRYAMAGARLATFNEAFATHHPDRLAAALLLTISGRERAGLFERWLRPRRRQQRGEASV